jgi:hypothetical protein
MDFRFPFCLLANLLLMIFLFLKKIVRVKDLLLVPYCKDCDNPMATIPTCQQGIYYCGLFASYFTAIYFGGKPAKE